MIRVTNKSIVKSWSDYRQRINDCGDEISGPADTYYQIADFEAAALHYGWGSNRNPLDTVNHMGDEMRLIDILIGSLRY